jgi:hypothetical protein
MVASQISDRLSYQKSAKEIPDSPFAVCDLFSSKSAMTPRNDVYSYVEVISCSKFR